VKSRSLETAIVGWALVLPTLAVLGFFVFLPAGQSLYLSFQEVDPLARRHTFIGFSNYRNLLFSPDYWTSVWVTAKFAFVTVVAGVGLALALAVALDANPYARGLMRTVFLLPVSISSAMAAMLWIFLYNPTAGYLNFLLDLVGGQGPNWLGSSKWALTSVAITTIWKEMGFSIIFLLAGLAGVPNELKEAALVDGAGPVRRFWHVTLPILSPTLFFVTVVSVIHSFESFGQIHILTGGGPFGKTTTLVYNLYIDAFVNFRTGYASAQAVLLFLLMMAATAVQFRIANKRVHYG